MFSNQSPGGGLFSSARPQNSLTTFFSQPQGPTTSFDFVGSTFTTKNRDGYLVASITANINQLSLEELRINDHFALKRNLLPEPKKQSIENLIHNNILRRDSQAGSVSGGFIPGTSSIPAPQANQTSSGFFPSGTFGGQPSAQTGFFGQSSSNLTPLNPVQPSGLFGGQPSAPTGFFGQPPSNPTPFNSLQAPSNLNSNSQTVFGLSTLPPPSSGGLFGHFNAPTSTSEKFFNQPTSTATSTLGSTTQQTNPLPQASLLVSTTGPSEVTPQSGLIIPPTQAPVGLIKQQETAIPAQNQDKSVSSQQTKIDAFFTVNKNLQSQPVAQSAVVNPQKVIVEHVQPVSIAPGEFKTQTVSSKPGGFSHEMNKMLFVSSLLELFGEHNIVFPEDLLETTDFMPQLFEFLGTYGIQPPQKFVPRFKINKSAVLAVIPPEARDDYREKEAEAQQVQRQQIQKSVVVQKEEETKQEEPKKGTALEIKTKQSQPEKDGTENDQSEKNEEDREDSEKEGSAIVIGESNEGGHEDTH